MSARAVAQVFANLFGQMFRLLPRRKRFDVARRMAVGIAPILRRTRYYDIRPSLLDGPREEALRTILRCMTRARVRFDPNIEVHGAELVAEGPVIIVSGHFLLNILLSRDFYDRGKPFAGVIGSPREPMYYAGSNVPVNLLYSGPTLFLRFRQRLSAGSTLFVDIDEEHSHEGWVAVDTSVTRRHVSPAVLRFAERMNAPVVFAATRFDEHGNVIITYARPSSSDANVALAEFCDFFRSEAEKIQR